MDSALLSHPLVNEAVSFGAPDDKYGEVVAAAVVLSKPVDDAAAVIADIRKSAATKLAKFKVRAVNILHTLCGIFTLYSKIGSISQNRCKFPLHCTSAATLSGLGPPEDNRLFHASSSGSVRPQTGLQGE